MAILGAIIKGVIDLKGALTGEPDQAEIQRKQLLHLLEKAKETAFGRGYDFAGILASGDPVQQFAEKVPFFDYNTIHETWWSRIHAGEEDVTWPGCPDYFALSSGTTGNTSKRIPVTRDMVESIRQAGIKQITALTNFDLPADFFEKEIMMLGSSTNLKEIDGKKEGEISGISASNIPFWFKGYYKPGEDIARVEDWEQRVQLIAERAAEWDIGALSGIPSWIELMLQKVIAYHQLNNIHEIWPHLQVYTSGGVAFEPYEKSFNALLGHPITVIDTYLASEGFIAFQQRPDTNAMKLVTDNGIYYEFVPFRPDYINEEGGVIAGAPSVPLSGVREGVEYVLLISTISGLWRYMIGDTVTFTDVERAEIRITGRTKFFLNVVGSQLSVNKMNEAMRHLEEHFDITIPEFTVAAVRINDEFNHSWYLGTTAHLDEAAVAKVLDEHLKQVNKNYGVARSKALKGVQVHLIPPDVFYDWNAHRKQKGGQVKMERVMKEEKFKEWETFVKENHAMT